MQQEGVVISCEVLSWCLPVRTEENHVNFENNYIQIKMQNEDLWMWSRSVNHVSDGMWMFLYCRGAQYQTPGSYDDQILYDGVSYLWILVWDVLHVSLLAIQFWGDWRFLENVCTPVILVEFHKEVKGASVTYHLWMFKNFCHSFINKLEWTDTIWFTLHTIASCLLWSSVNYNLPFISKFSVCIHLAMLIPTWHNLRCSALLCIWCFVYILLYWDAVLSNITVHFPLSPLCYRMSHAHSLIFLHVLSDI
jgi:hypothetical protein